MYLVPPNTKAYCYQISEEQDEHELRYYKKNL